MEKMNEKTRKIIKSIVENAVLPSQIKNICSIDMYGAYITITIREEVNGFLFDNLLNLGFSVNSMRYFADNKFTVVFRFPEIMDKINNEKLILGVE